ncbi:MAG: ribosome-binding factor A [Planctomycetota bacterium]|jgi:ribosome-binding factor A
MTDRKTRQLCAQVRRTLSHFLCLEARDQVLQSLLVESVQPAPDATHLAVVVSVPKDLELPQEDILARLTKVKGVLRSELAQAVSRRKVPDLSFQLVRSPH